MRFLIEEDLDKNNDDWDSQPLRYRVSLSFYDNIVLKREYFRVGFLAGEEDDKFYIDLEINKYSSPNQKSTTHISFITRNFDKKYLQEKENELFRIAYKYILKSKKNWKKYIKEKIKEEKQEQKKLNVILNSNKFIKLQREEKLEKINKINEN